MQLLDNPNHAHTDDPPQQMQQSLAMCMIYELLVHICFLLIGINTGTIFPVPD